MEQTTAAHQKPPEWRSGEGALSPRAAPKIACVKMVGIVLRPCRVHGASLAPSLRRFVRGLGGPLRGRALGLRPFSEVVYQAASSAGRRVFCVAAGRNTFVAPRIPHPPFTGLKTLGAAFTNSSCRTGV